MAFFQAAPALRNTYVNDWLLRSLVARSFPPDALAGIELELEQMGELAVAYHAREIGEGREEPKLVPFDPWGRRVDRIEHTAYWKDMARIAAEKGLVATAYERRTGEHSRLHQFALVYLFEPISHVYTCPLAMTDGAARILQGSSLAARALPRLLSRDPLTMWTSGQWMTERTGGSDVGISETIARKDGDAFRLYGTKWFTSAATSEMTLTLARPEGNPAGGRGLALFYLETRGEDGAMNGIRVLRLKDKLGTRMLPTAELELEGALATPVFGLSDGVKNISPMLTITRTWNAVCSTGGTRRLLDLAIDYAKKRVAFGAPLAEQPLHVDTLAGVAAEHAGAFLLAMRCAELLGKEDAGSLSEREAQLLRLLVPIAKLTTGKQAVAIASELVEAFGGAGYVEDTGIPRLLRDAQVLPIWEGTTNVLSLDVLRALKKGSLAPVEEEIERCTRALDPLLAEPATVARRAFTSASAWLVKAVAEDAVEPGARRFALTLGRALELALLCEHATWALSRGERRPLVAALRFARSQVDLTGDLPDASALVG